MVLLPSLFPVSLRRAARNRLAGCVAPEKPGQALASPHSVARFHRCALYARAKAAVPRASSMRGAIRRVVAGRINKKVARSSSQLNATAAAVARSVAITSVANCSVAIMTDLRCCDLGYRTVMTNLKILIMHDLQGIQSERFVWALTRCGPRHATIGGFYLLGVV